MLVLSKRRLLIAAPTSAMMNLSRKPVMNALVLSTAGGGRRTIWSYERAKARLDSIQKTIEDRKEEMIDGVAHGGFTNQQSTKKSAYRKPAQYFKGVHYDETGRFLVLHHEGAFKYYRMNVAILFLFLGATLYSYVYNAQVFFGKEWLANLYMFAIQGGIVGLYIFSNRHIRQLHLLKGGQSVSITTYSNFGFTHNRPRILDISQLQGNRLFGSQKMNVYQLEYSYKSSYAKLTRHKSFFYRPEYIASAPLWKAVRQGNDIISDDDVAAQAKQTKHSSKDQERQNWEKELKKQLDGAKNMNSPRHKYR